MGDLKSYMLCVFLNLIIFTVVLVHFSVKYYCGFLPFMVIVLFYLLHNIKDLFSSFQMEDQDHSGYLLFKKEQAHMLKEKGIKVTNLNGQSSIKCK